MAEVIIELELNRRSGVLAAAIAALRHLSLSFASQQLRDQDGTPKLILTTEGQVDSVADVEAVYASIRGVSAVIDVRVEGQSLAAAVDGIETEIDASQTAISDSPEETAELEREAELDPQFFDPPVTIATQEGLIEEQAAGTWTGTGTGTDHFSAEVFARHVLIDAGSEEPIQEPIEEPLPANITAVEDETPDSMVSQPRGALKPAMFRRRRRHR